MEEPPKRKNNKRKQIARKKAVTIRLMTISLIVDKYIYKNKPITISQAQIYLKELTSFKPQCLGDAPSLQVCEKLTRCMRGIIDEQQSNDAVLEDEDNEDTFIELNNSNNLYAASPVYSLPDEDKTHIASEQIPDLQLETNMSNYNLYNPNGNTRDGNEESNDGPRKLVRFCFDNEIVNVTPEISKDINNEDFHYINTNRHCNVEDKITNVIVDLTLKDIEQPITMDIDLYSQSILKHLETNETSKTLVEYCMNDSCGQDMLEFDREIENLLQHKDQDCVEYNKDTVPHTTTIKNPPATMKKIPDVPKSSDVAEIRMDFVNKPETKTVIINKSTQDAKNQKKKISKKRNKENTPQTKRGNNKTNSKITKKIANTEVLTPLKNNIEEALQDSKNTISERFYGSNIGENGDRNIKKDNQSNIVQQHSGTKNSNNIVDQNVGSNVSNMNVPKFVCLKEDLSWVENLTYVREIHLEEYDYTLKPRSEAFWNNCELPDSWDGRDFD